MRDASVLIAHLNPLDHHHDVATGFLLTGATETLLVHGITMAEVLVGGAKTGQAEALLRELTDIGVQVDTSDASEPLRPATLRVDTGLKLPDGCVLARPTLLSTRRRQRWELGAVQPGIEERVE